MPNYSGIWSLPQQMQAIGAGNWTGIPVYFIATLDGTGNEYANGVSVDNNKNIIISGYSASTGSGNNDMLIAQYSSEGSINWQRYLSGAGQEYGRSVVTDSSGNIYLVGTDSSTSDDIALIKYNSSGILQWQKKLTGAGQDRGWGVTIDSSGYIYVCGDSFFSSLYNGLIAKYDSSGTLQWQRYVNVDSFNKIVTDSSNNIYAVGGASTSTAGSIDYSVVKYNSSGTLQWQRILGSTGNDIGYGIALDSASNVYVVGYGNIGSNNAVVFAKYNSSGTLQWQRYLDGGAGSEFGYGITIDSNDYIYISGQASGGLIAKYDSSGVIQWQRLLTPMAAFYGIKVDNEGAMYIAGYGTGAPLGGSQVVLAKLPADGSLTGTYGSWTYAAASLTDGVNTFTGTTSSYANGTSTLTNNSGSLSDSTSSLTSTVITL